MITTAMTEPRRYVLALGTVNPRVKYCKETVQGIGYARNCGGYAATGNIIAYLDDDEWASPQWVEELVRVFAAHREVGCVGGRTILEDKHCIPFWAGRLAGLLGEWEVPNCQGQEYYFIGKAGQGGGNLAVHKDVFLKIGGFKSELGRTGGTLLADEDYQFCYRAYDANFCIVYNPRTVAFHALFPSRLGLSNLRRHAEGMALTRVKRGKLLDYSGEVLYRSLRLAAAFLWPRMMGHNLYRFFVAFFKLKLLLQGHGLPRKSAADPGSQPT